MYSINYQGKVLDYHYKKQTDIIYAFYVGDILVGQIFKMPRNSWAAVSWKPNDICPVEGFKTRRHASEFLLRVGLLENK